MHERWGGGFKSPQRSGWLVMMLTQSGTTVAPVRYQPGCLDAPLQGRWPSHLVLLRLVFVLVRLNRHRFLIPLQSKHANK